MQACQNRRVASKQLCRGEVADDLATIQLNLMYH